MATKHTDGYCTEEDLACGKDFRAAVVSFFDGMLTHHQALLLHGKALCGGNPDNLLVVVCARDREKPLPPGAAPAILSPGERLHMLHHLGYHHVYLLTITDHRNAAGKNAGEKSTKSLTDGQDSVPGTGILFTKARQVIAGADVQHLKPFRKLPGIAPEGTFTRPASPAPDTARQKHPGIAPDKANNPHHDIIQLIESGQVEAAGKALGFAYPLEGQVVEGNRIGRTLGYPTANLRQSDHHKAEPGQGVYVALVQSGGTWYRSMVNIGIRPTLDMEHVTIEAHLFDFDKDIYGEMIAIAFLGRIRDEMRFNSLSQLKMQLHQDSIRAKQELDRLAPKDRKPSDRKPSDRRPPGKRGSDITPRDKTPSGTTGNFVFIGHPGR